MFSLNHKIEEIREKPEHIRIRYVWGMVALSMLLIILIWAFSVRENFRNLDLRADDLEGSGFQLNESGIPSGADIQSEIKQLPQKPEGSGRTNSITELDSQGIGE